MTLGGSGRYMFSFYIKDQKFPLFFIFRILWGILSLASAPGSVAHFFLGSASRFFCLPLTHQTDRNTSSWETDAEMKRILTFPSATAKTSAFLLLELFSGFIVPAVYDRPHQHPSWVTGQDSLEAVETDRFPGGRWKSGPCWGRIMRGLLERHYHTRNCESTWCLSYALSNKSMLPALCWQCLFLFLKDLLIKKKNIYLEFFLFLSINFLISI